jgi:cytochrome bd-type quinol oxidase subunit 2
LKTNGDVEERARRVGRRLPPALVVLVAGTTAVTLTGRSQMLDNYRASAWLLAVPLLIPASLAAVWHFQRTRRDLEAFVSSAGLIAALVASTAIGFYPSLPPPIRIPSAG